MIPKWPQCEVSEALELLGRNFLDPVIFLLLFFFFCFFSVLIFLYQVVREYAVDSLSTLDDYTLLDYFPQLVFPPFVFFSSSPPPPPLNPPFSPNKK